MGLQSTQGNEKLYVASCLSSERSARRARSRGTCISPAYPASATFCVCFSTERSRKVPVSPLFFDVPRALPSARHAVHSSRQRNGRLLSLNRLQVLGQVGNPELGLCCAVTGECHKNWSPNRHLFAAVSGRHGPRLNFYGNVRTREFPTVLCRQSGEIA